MGELSGFVMVKEPGEREGGREGEGSRGGSCLGPLGHVNVYPRSTC